MSRIGMFISLWILFIQCNQQAIESAPVSADDFIKITTQLYFMEAHFQGVSFDFSDSVLVANRNKIYHEFKTNDSLFQLSKKIYNSDNKRMLELENKVKMEMDKYKDLK